MKQSPEILARFQRNWEKQTLNIGNHKVIYITNNLLHVFLFSGWENAVKIKINKKNNSFVCVNDKQQKDPTITRIISNVIMPHLGEI